MDIKRMIYEKFKFRSTRSDNLPWCSPHGNRGDLAALFGEADFNVGAEIGVRRGDYSKVLLDANPKLRLTCVDPWIAYNKIKQDYQDDAEKVFRENMALYADRVSILKKTSIEALSDVKNDILDFVWIDGNHKFDYAAPDIIYWSQKVKRGGIVAMHDYYHCHWNGVVFAVDAYTRAHAIYEWYCTRERDVTAFWVKP